jgi:dephospho-CoA kinase
VLTVIVAGLTGGIATGKSTVSQMLATLGARVVDADRIARQVVAKGLPAWQRIVTAFGRGVLLPEGEINRSVLADMVFGHPDKQATLNRIVHPKVREEMQRRIVRLRRSEPSAVVVLDVPLLIEAEWLDDLDEIILVYTPESIQLQRLMVRDGLSESDALRRIRSQMPVEQKLAQSTIIIDNSGTLEATRKQTEQVYQKLCRRIGSNSAPSS